MKAPTPLPRRRMRRRALLTLACALALSGTRTAHAGPVDPDAVSQWIGTANSLTAALPLPLKLHAMAMAQIAVHDALNAIQPRYQSYTGLAPASVGARIDAAVATATRDVLLGLSGPKPDAAAVNDSYDTYMEDEVIDTCASDASVCAGIDAGAAAAAAILAARGNDIPAILHPDYTLEPTAGVYQPTPGMPGTFPRQPPFPAFAGWADSPAFALHTSRQFRAEWSDLLDVTSGAFAADFNEVKSEGAYATRSADPDGAESSIARFWYGSGGHDWFNTAKTIVTDYNAAPGADLDQWQQARLFALLAIGQVDVTVSVFDNKYHYSFWRPVTAIRQAEPTQDDSNPDTTADPGWSPYLVTPPYPDYPCGTPMLAGAATEVLRDFFGTDDVAYTVTSHFHGSGIAIEDPADPEDPSDFDNYVAADEITLHFDSLSEAADQSAQARVWAGIHFGTGCRVGVAQGEKIGRHTFKHYLQPLR